ncbi:MAG: hypothetical protein QCI38_07055 [Candidatus Thermoplasmatota archaeon]|nr:hypothetical protein [Candidatus Thermoplasmatota archaeon]
MYEEGKKRLLKMHLIVAVPVSIIVYFAFTDLTGTQVGGIFAAIMTFPLAIASYWVQLVWVMSILNDEELEEK